MAVKSATLAGLLAEGLELESLGESIQGARELTVSTEDLRGFADRYLRWMGDALAVLADDLAAKFRNEYEGGIFTPKIKKFLEAPGESSPLYDEESTSTLLPYWQTPSIRHFARRCSRSGRSFSKLRRVPPWYLHRSTSYSWSGCGEGCRSSLASSRTASA